MVWFVHAKNEKMDLRHLVLQEGRRSFDLSVLFVCIGLLPSDVAPQHGLEALSPQPARQMLRHMTQAPERQRVERDGSHT